MTTTISRARPAPRTSRYRLGARARKVWLLVHIVAAGIWLGIDIVLGILVVTAMGTSDPAVAGTVFRALELFAIGPLIGISVLTFASGIVLGWGTKYGIVRYRWVVVKLVLNTGLTLLILFSLSDTLREAAANAEMYALQGVPDIASLLAPPIVSTTAVLIATALSVFKPWGRMRRNP